VHDRAVSITVDVAFKTLMWIAPAHYAPLPCWNQPSRKSIKCPHEGMGSRGRFQIDESIPKASLGVEVDRQVEKVVQAGEAHLINVLQEHRPCVIVWQVSQHHCGAALSTWEFGSRLSVMGFLGISAELCALGAQAVRSIELAREQLRCLLGRSNESNWEFAAHGPVSASRQHRRCGGGARLKTSLTMEL
jgi:hypothetical protein